MYKKKLIVLFSCIFFISPLLFSCSRKPKYSITEFCLVIQATCIHEKTKIKVVTNKGNIVFELNGKSAPVTSGNFLKLMDKGFYENTEFKTVIKSPLPFIVQIGDPFKKMNNKKTNLSNITKIYKKKSMIAFIPLEIKLTYEDFPRYNNILKKYDELSNIELPHKRGSISMARTESLGSASYKFYISLRDLPELDGRYAVFGKIINGMNIIDSIEEGDYIINMKRIDN